jgi:hypothetical protein
MATHGKRYTDAKEQVPVGVGVGGRVGDLAERFPVDLAGVEHPGRALGWFGGHRYRLGPPDGRGFAR